MPRQEPLISDGQKRGKSQYLLRIPDSLVPRSVYRVRKLTKVVRSVLTELKVSHKCPPKINERLLTSLTRQLESSPAAPGEQSFPSLSPMPNAI